MGIPVEYTNEPDDFHALYRAASCAVEIRSAGGVALRRALADLAVELERLRPAFEACVARCLDDRARGRH